MSSVDPTKVLEKPEIKLNSFDRHITLYAKGWYEKKDIMNDLKTIMNKISVGTAYSTDVYEQVMDTFLKLSPLEARKAEIFWKDLFFNHCIRTNKEDISPEDMVGYLLEFIDSIHIADRQGNKIVELGKADYNILPPDPKKIF